MTHQRLPTIPRHRADSIVSWAVFAVAVLGFLGAIACEIGTTQESWPIDGGFFGWFVLVGLVLIPYLGFRFSRLNAAQRRAIREWNGDLAGATAAPKRVVGALSAICTAAVLIGMLSAAQGMKLDGKSDPGGRYTLSEHGGTVHVNERHYREEHHDIERFGLTFVIVLISGGMLATWPARGADDDWVPGPDRSDDD